MIWLVSCLLASQVVLAAIDDYFKMSFTTSVSGNCVDYEDVLDEQMEDAITLADYVSEAAQYAVADLASLDETDEKKALVARKLFTAYFGIEFDGSTPTDEDDWDDLTSNINTYKTYIDSKDYPTPKNAPRLFCGNFGEWFEWDDQALGPDGKGLTNNDGDGLSIQDVYSNWYSKNKYTPYWVPETNNYMFMPNTYAEDICDSIVDDTGAPLLGLAARGNKEKVEAIDGSDTPIQEVSSPESIVLCPKSFEEDGYFGLYATLDDVEAVVSEEMDNNGLPEGLQLSQILPRSATLYHEIWHMVTFWYDNGNKVLDAGDSAVGDVTYNLGKALEIGTEGIGNAESYVFFAIAWWFYASRTDWGNEQEGTFFTETFEPWTYGSSDSDSD